MNRLSLAARGLAVFLAASCAAPGAMAANFRFASDGDVSSMDP
jgi:hypothetical protein